MNDKRGNINKKITNVSMILSVLVVFIHTYNIEIYKVTNNSDIISKLIIYLENLISQNIARIAVPTFFIISGFLFFNNIKGNLLKKVKKRIITLGVPYLLWNSIYYIFFLISSYFIELDLEVSFNAKNIIHGIFLHKYNNVFWYIKYLILFTLGNLVIYRLIKRKKVILSLLGILLIINIFIINNMSVIYDSYFFYLLGGYLALYNPNIINNKYKYNWVILSFFAFISTAICRNNISINIFNFEFLTCIIMIFFFWILSDALTERIRVNRNYSFIIYASHILILEVIEKLIYLFLPHNAILALIDYIVAPIISILIIYIASNIMRKYARRVYSILTGGRF